MWQQTRPPTPLAEFRSDVPPGLQEILDKMMAKEPARRYAEPAQVAEALAPFTQVPIAPPPESEMPHLSPAASGAGPQDGGANTPVIKSSSMGPRFANSASSVSAELSPVSAPKSPVPNSVPSRPAANRGGALKVAPRPITPSARTASKQRVATLSPADEERLSENVASETQHLAAKEDTAPQPLRSPQPARDEELAQRKARRRLWGVIGAFYVVLLSTVGILLLRLLIN
jgi:eukaryotic-like serine/threonine-protein kinase